MINMVDLKCEYDSRISFYSKAKVEIIRERNIYNLYSYNTLVASVDNGHPILHGVWSMTTTRHQKEFLKQFANISDEEFKQLQKEVRG